MTRSKTRTTTIYTAQPARACTHLEQSKDPCQTARSASHHGHHSVSLHNTNWWFRSNKKLLKGEILNGWATTAELSKCPKPHARKVSRWTKPCSVWWSSFSTWSMSLLCELIGQVEKERSPSFLCHNANIARRFFHATDALVLVRCHCRYGASKIQKSVENQTSNLGLNQEELTALAHHKPPVSAADEQMLRHEQSIRAVGDQAKESSGERTTSTDAA